MTSGARLIDSTPPATNRSPSPAAIAWHAETTAESPDAQSRLTVTPATDSGSPASSARHARDVAVVLAGLVRAAEVDVLDLAAGRRPRARRPPRSRPRRGRRAAHRRARRRSARRACAPPRGRPRGSPGGRPRAAHELAAAVRADVCELARASDAPRALERADVRLVARSEPRAAALAGPAHLESHAANASRRTRRDGLA